MSTQPPDYAPSTLPAVAQELPAYNIEEQSWWKPLPSVREVPSEELVSLAGEIDIVLVTATDFEVTEVLRRLEPYPGRRSVLKGVNEQETYYLGKFGTCLTAVTKCRMGSLDSGGATLATQHALCIWRPRAVIMVGVALGKDPEKQQIADVLVASQVISYEPQRVGERQIVSRGPITPASTTLLNRFENVPHWSFCRPDGSTCTRQVGAVLSGEKLVDDAVFKAELFNRYPQAIGGDMEGAGFAAAAMRHGTDWILVKGICDWADGRKDNKHQPLAAAAAVSIVRDVLSQPEVLHGLHKLKESPQRVTNRTAVRRTDRAADGMKLSALSPKEPRVRLAISRVLQLLDADRFGDIGGQHQHGGWAKSYGTTFLPRAFGQDRPGSLSLSDSVTVTHWVIRGLQALRRLASRFTCLTHQESSLVTTLLTDASNYLRHHCKDGKGGLWTFRQGGPKFEPDVRHSATLAKGLLQYAGEDSALISRVLVSVIDAAIVSSEEDRRIPTIAEVLAVIDILEQRPDLCKRIDPVKLNQARRIQEDALWSCYRAVDVNQKPVANSVPFGLFFDPKAGPHMALYYTWWVLDCYGRVMQRMRDQKSREIYQSVVRTMALFEQSGPPVLGGFPLERDGVPDLGATAQVALVLCRLKSQRDLLARSTEFVVRGLDVPVPAVACPYMLWSFFDLLEIAASSLSNCDEAMSPR